MYELPIDATPSQQFLVTLEEQNCIINLYQRRDRLYMDLFANDVEVARGVVCLPRVPLLQLATANFDGNFYFTDERSAPAMQQPPHWRELGSRFHLYYLAEDEMDYIDGERWADALESVDA